jgi:hypothetical protein
MFALGFICMFSLAFFEASNMKRIAMNDEIKNLMLSTLALTGGIVSLSIYIAVKYINDNSHKIEDDLLILQDYKFYLALISEFLGIYLSRRNYSENGDNMSYINFALFSSLVIVPIYAYFLTGPLGFENTLSINYQSSYEFIYFVLSMALLMVIFFFDKIKNNKINNIKILLLLPLVLSNSMFLTGKLMQEYNGFLAYGLIVILLSIIFLSFVIKNKEYKKFKKEEHKKPLIYLIITWALVIPLNTIAIKLLAIELVTLLKRISQVISGVLLDYLYKNKNNLNNKDYMVILLIFIIGFKLQHN